MKIYIKAGYDDIPEENKHGDCYVTALHTFQDFYENGMKDVKLVHGVVTGQGPLDGIEYNHAWVELNDAIVCDYSNGNNVVMPISQYYNIGNIDITKKYNIRDVANMVSKYGTYGPWDPIFDNYP